MKKVELALRSDLDHLQGNVQRTTVRVADTGVEGLDSQFFPLAALSVNRDATDEKPDVNGFGRYGIAPPASGWEIRPPRNYPYHIHGTEVADLVLGTSTFRRDYPAIYNLIGLNFGRLFDGPINGPFVVVDALVSSSLTAKPPEPVVVNFSVGGSTRIVNFYETMLGNLNREVVAVVAAGNDPQDIGILGHATYPASLGGEESPLFRNMIVVGAYGPDGKITKFSSYGSKKVDVLAPGCRIPFTGPDGAATTLHGTSFAAPFVSFVAASLHALGVRANEIKSRIYASGDYDAALGSFVISSSRLNIVRALRLFDDVLVPDQGEDVPGVVQLGQDARICKGQPPIPVTSLLKLDVLESSPPRISILVKSDYGGADRSSCEPQSDGVSFARSGYAPEFKVWSSIKSITMAVWRQ